MTDPHDQWIQNTLQPLRDVPPSPRQEEIRAQFLREAVSEGAISRPNEQVTTQPKERSMFIVNRNRTLAASVALVLGIFVSFFVSPNLRALAQEILDSFFEKEATNVIQHEIYIASSIDEYRPNQMSLEEAENTLGYKPILPDSPVNRYDFQYVSLVEESDTSLSTFTDYICSTAISPYVLTIVQTSLAQAITEEKIRIGADAVIEQIDLGNGFTGEYVRGEWDYEIPPQIGTDSSGRTTWTYQSGVTVPASGTWDNDINLHHTIWIQGDWQFTIYARGGETDETLCPLTKDDIIRMAREMVSQTPDATSSADTEGTDDGFFVREGSDVKDTRLYLHYNLTAEDRAYYEERELTLDEAQTALSYDLVLPTIPIGYDLKYVVLERFEGSSDFVAPIAQYTCEIGGGVFSIIHQSSDSPQFMGGETSVGANALVSTVLLGEDTEGELVKGMWDYPDVLPTPDAEGNVNYPVESGGFVPITGTWNNDLDAFELRWTSHGKHYQIFANGGVHQEYRCKITKMDIIRMAREIVKAEASN